MDRKEDDQCQIYVSLRTELYFISTEIICYNTIPKITIKRVLTWIYFYIHANAVLTMMSWKPIRRINTVEDKRQTIGFQSFIDRALNVVITQHLVLGQQLCSSWSPLPVSHLKYIHKIVTSYRVIGIGLFIYITLQSFVRCWYTGIRY